MKAKIFPSVPKAFFEHHLGLWLGLLCFLSLQLIERSTSWSIWILCGLLYCCAGGCIYRSALASKSGKCAIVLLAASPLCLAISHLHTNALFQLPTLGRQTALFALGDIGEFRSAHGEMWSLSGALTFENRAQGKSKRASKIRCRLLIPKGCVALCAGRWQIEGTLSKRPFAQDWDFKPNLKRRWRAVPTPWSKVTARWAIWRWRAKAHFAKHITECLPATRARAFILGLCTGRQPDTRLSFDLSHVGLSHLLAVSGFHFACVIIACEWAMSRCALGRYPRVKLLPPLMYFAYMGPSASVFRAAIMSTWRILTQMSTLPYRPLQGLGWSLTLWCLLWPDCTRELGFMLSYLCTAALLLLSGPIGSGLNFLWPPSSQSARTPLGRLDRFARAAIGADLVAHCITFMPQLYLWHFFPIASLWYNAFVPPCIGLLMQLLLLASACTVFPPLSHLLFRSAHALLVPLVATLNVSRPWECLWWGECSANSAAWATAVLLGGGVIWNARNYRPNPIERWIF